MHGAHRRSRNSVVEIQYIVQQQKLRNQIFLQIFTIRFFWFQKKVDSVLGDKRDEKEFMPVEEIRRMSENIEWNRKTLRQAFDENPYERYKTKVSPRFSDPIESYSEFH